MQSRSPEEIATLYEAFDPFIGVDTWHSKHPEDERRFFRSLAMVAEDPDFNPDHLGAYMAKKRDLDSYPEDHPLNVARDYYVAASWAVRSHLRATGEIP